MAVLMREAIGGSLRRARTEGRRTLRDVSRRARVSLGYLSEVERGRKEASSELLAAICEALEISLPDVLAEAAEVIARSLAADGAEVLLPARRPIGLRHMDLRLAGTEPIAAPIMRRAAPPWPRCRCAACAPPPEPVPRVTALVSGRPDIGLRIIPDIVDLGWKSGPHRCHDGVRSR